MKPVSVSYLKFGFNFESFEGFFTDFKVLSLIYLFHAYCDVESKSPQLEIMDVIYLKIDTCVWARDGVSASKRGKRR